MSKIDRLKALQDSINKSYGEGALIVGSDAGVSKLESIPTGSLQLDHILGIGGLPKGRIVEIYGPESSGKTTLALSVIAEAQKLGAVVGFVDAEHALDSTYAAKLGVDMEGLMISQPDNGEQGLDITEKLISSGVMDVVVVDSVAALTPKAEIEGEMGQSHVGLQARMMSQALRKITAATANSKTLVIFINQLRMKIGVMFGNPETTTGGNALKFYASVRLDCRAAEKIKNGDEVIGHFLRVKTVKNKVASPHKSVEIPLIYGKGFDRAAEVYALARQFELIEVAGASHRLDGELVARSQKEMVDKIREDETLRLRLENEITEKKKAS